MLILQNQLQPQLQPEIAEDYKEKEEEEDKFPFSLFSITSQTLGKQKI